MNIERKVGPKGQIVIPEEIRKITGIMPKSHVFVSLEDGKIFITPEKVKLYETLEQQVKRDGIFLEKLDLDKLHEEEALNRFKKAK
ncbi:MAG: AbrB/MazE/SpoVT family DNA-binding domain-containing protein [Candidatus Aenigmarchaeota archaeon]|nr:AbrB/MazE/SpoVT family DNA-binding domain-containing protein [Candidatus Aenigmarchaeota archaeon]